MRDYTVYKENGKYKKEVKNLLQFSKCVKQKKDNEEWNQQLEKEIVHYRPRDWRSSFNQ